MNLLPDEEQREIIAATAAFLAREMPICRLRELLEEGKRVDAKVWQGSAELGWFALGLPEDLGGVGGSLADEALLFREIGRSLAPGPYLSTALGARVAALGGAGDLADAIAAGRSRVGLGVLEPGASLGAGRLIGSLRLIDAHGASHVLIADSAAAALVAASELGEIVGERCIDDASALSRVKRADAPWVARVAASDDPIYLRGLVLSAAMLCGIAEACRDLGVGHAKERVQFDRPIGVHQAIKHPCADMAICAEAAWCQTAMASVVIGEGREGAAFHALCARLVAVDAAERNAAATLQIFGGMGFTYESDVQLYLRRARVLAHALSDTRVQLEELIAL